MSRNEYLALVGPPSMGNRQCLLGETVEGETWFRILVKFGFGPSELSVREVLTGAHVEAPLR
jgi:hypothetical protein